MDHDHVDINREGEPVIASALAQPRPSLPNRKASLMTTDLTEAQITASHGGDDYNSPQVGADDAPATPAPASAPAPTLEEACKPWEFSVGDPPEWGSPLHHVFVAGMIHTERLLADFLDVKSYEGGDGSEDFDADATMSLQNILTEAGLYDPESSTTAKLPGADISHTWPTSAEDKDDAGPYADFTPGVGPVGWNDPGPGIEPASAPAVGGGLKFAGMSVDLLRKHPADRWPWTREVCEAVVLLLDPPVHLSPRADAAADAERIQALEEALRCFLEDERFQVAVGGNPNVVRRMIASARAALNPTQERPA